MTTTLPDEGYRLTGISPKAYEHPADRAATAALATVPHLDTVVRRLISLGYERALRQASLGAAVRLGPNQLPDLFAEHHRAYATLDMGDPPPLYLTQMPMPNAFAVGAKNPHVVIGSEAVRLLDAGGRRAVLAHEAAHILSDHQLYRTALAILLRLTQAARLPLPLAPVRLALLEWSRAAELTCDRAAALVVRDPLVVCRVHMVLAAGEMAERLDLDAFLAQALEYTEGGSGIDRLTRLFADLGLTHPLPVRRCHELMRWVRDGEFDRIAGGSYVRRGEEADARTQAAGAAEHYGDRVRDAMKDAGDSVADVGTRLRDWLDRTQRGPET